MAAPRASRGSRWPTAGPAAFKIEDGAARGRVPVTVALLRALGAESEPGADTAKLAELANSPVFGGGRVVGAVRAIWLATAGPPSGAAPLA